MKEKTFLEKYPMFKEIDLMDFRVALNIPEIEEILDKHFVRKEDEIEKHNYVELKDSKLLVFDTDEKGQVYIWDKNNFPLGNIYYYSIWRKFVFSIGELVFDESCLIAILKRLKEETNKKTQRR